MKWTAGELKKKKNPEHFSKVLKLIHVILYAGSVPNAIQYTELNMFPFIIYRNVIAEALVMVYGQTDRQTEFTS